MSTRTIIELDHDFVASVRTLGDLHDLLRRLTSGEVTEELNRHKGQPFVWNHNRAIRVLGQRQQHEPEWKQPRR